MVVIMKNLERSLIICNIDINTLLNKAIEIWKNITPEKMLFIIVLLAIYAIAIGIKQKKSCFKESVLIGFCVCVFSLFLYLIAF